MPICGWTAGITLEDDAYHFDAKSQRAGNYIEWWYFNFYQEDIQGVIAFAFADPSNRLGFERASVLSLVYLNNEKFCYLDDYNLNEATASYQKADIDIGGNVLFAINEDKYEMHGMSKNKRLKWRLNYNRLDEESWYPFKRESVGFMPWEWMDWLIFMPKAEVSGYITLDGVDYPIDAIGYHDHNWGEWIYLEARWNWMQFYGEEDLNIELGQIYSKIPSIGSMMINYDGKRIIFESRELHILHLRWLPGATFLTFFPTKSIVMAKNEEYFLWYTLETTSTEEVRVVAPFFFPDVLIYESLASIKGGFYQKDEQDSENWVELKKIQGQCFWEYTGQDWFKLFFY